MTAATRVRRNAINGWLLGLCCLVCLVVVAQGSSPPAASAATAISKDAAATHKGLYTKTKRQDKQRGITDVMMQQQQQQQQPSLTRNAHGLNKKMLSKMGFMKVKAPNSHNRKRLAVESRRHASSDDSHMFIIKLPPNLHYYTGPHNPVKNSLDHHQQQHQQQQKQQQQLSTGETSPTATTEASALKTNGKKVSFPFSSNGRPGRIYHWNLPVLKQALHKQKQKQLSAQTNLGHDDHPQLQSQPHWHPHHFVSTADRNRLLDIEKQQPTWRKPWENETIEKSFNGKSKYKKSLKPKSPTYYAPAQAVSKQSFHKYFAGNGKPKGFYVIKEHQTKPQFYQNIIS
ncbi:LOW QUALITY PROTEIN: uncharacterized protein [Drosophila tropicalis]|uniref:LOW QUALITY PROTEIN: uncharacterized protein n=1 Tax=Drosophila tropicalis TaxID=46794 RepID=UPI0035ABCDFD